MMPSPAISAASTAAGEAAPEISVVIPTHKRRDFLERAVVSVCKAADASGLAPGALEIVIADDGHTKETEALCLTLAASIGRPLIYLRTKRGPSQGPAAGRNLGTMHARGLYIYFLDDDDVFLPNRFVKSLPLLRSGEYDAVCEHTLREYADGSGRASFVTGPPARIPPGPTGPLEYMLTCDQSGHITPNASAYRRDFIGRIGGMNEGLMFAQDGEFLMRVAVHARLALLCDAPVAVAYTHAANHTRPARRRYYNNIRSLTQSYRAFRAKELRPYRDLVARVASGKLDFVLTRYRLEASTYWERLEGGALSLWYFPWACLRLQNLKSVCVWLAKRGGA